MKKAKHLIAVGIGLCTSVTVLYWKLHKKKSVPAEKVTAPEPECVENLFCGEWITILEENARVFNGLYNGLLRVVSGNAKKPEKILREWIQRTHYKFENQSVDVLCQENIRPLIEAEDREALTKWANCLLDAALAAGIAKEEMTELVLTEANADAYVEWDGNDLYPEDKIEIITPAWYQKGKILEQGQCRKTYTEE